MTPKNVRCLRQLAKLHGIQTSYRNIAGEDQHASPETLVALLHALGCSFDPETDLNGFCEQVRSRELQGGLEPVTVIWDGKATRLRIRLSDDYPPGKVLASVLCEDGQRIRCRILAAGRGPGTASILEIPHLPIGYHQIQVETQGVQLESLVLAAPSESYAEPEAGRQWGLFLPMYAAHSKRSWGAGNFSDWQAFCEFTASFGGAVAGTLPLLASFLGSPVMEPSPYSPASRLFWNEFFIDVEAIPELAENAAAKKLIRSAGFRRKLADFARASEVDYAQQSAVRRQVMELLAARFFAQRAGVRRRAFESFQRAQPQLMEYARFRAVCEQAGTSWHNWPDRLRNGSVRSADFAIASRQYHAYVQFIAQEQVTALSDKCHVLGVKLYLDLPLGVHPDSYDVWRWRDAFAMQASTGAPPDPFFSKGQNWGFAPLHPRAIREQGYEYVLKYLRFQMRHAKVLRIDHVMGLHRLFWVPKGLSPQQGAYVTYPANELYALLSLESHRNKTILVGENLGTVPPQVNRGMDRHGLRRMFVLQFEQRPNPAEALSSPPKRCMASLNTHDMPTFASQWQGKDIAGRMDLGLLSKKEARMAHARRRKRNQALIAFLRRAGWLKQRRPDLKDIMEASIRWLGASRAETVLINLEDLWLEENPQNVPGTAQERPNWRRKARLSLEQVSEDSRIRSVLEGLDRIRRGQG